MRGNILRRLTGMLLVIVPIAFTALFTLLQVQFEYPDILRQPTADVLTKFQAGGTGLIAAWYGLTITAVLFIPLVVLLHRTLAPERAPVTLWVATAFGVVAGLAQALGFLRWPFRATPGGGIPRPGGVRGAARGGQHGLRGLPPLRWHGSR
jgi:Domain of unknown function (DUF4386)